MNISPLEYLHSNSSKMQLLFVTLAVTILAYLLISTLLGIFRAVRSPLQKIPGPWYAPLTAFHLRYLFSTGEIWKLVQRSHAKYGPICRLGPRHVWVSDKESLKQILSTIDLPKVAMYAEISRDRTSPGLFGEIRFHPHKRLKRFLSPAFTVGYVDNLEAVFKGVMRDLLQTYATLLAGNTSTLEGVQTDLMDDLHKVALDICDSMGESSFSKGFGQVKPNEPSGDPQMDETWKSVPRAIFDGLADRYKYVYVKRFLRRIGFNVEFDWPKQMIMAIDSIVRQRSDEKQHSPDLLQHLIENGKRPDNEEAMNSRDILDQMSEILLAGSETTSGTIACLFLELARNPRVRAKLLASLPSIRNDEVDDIIVSKTIRDSENFQYLEACIKENLRLHPIASEMGRRTGDQWINLMGYDLPPHTVVSASYRDLHRNEKYWPDALSFIPERWLPDNERGDYPAAEYVVATPWRDTR
ncbi:cytochrome P450 monooxygenase family 3 subfamily A [Fusarium napiforme]|uniref:Cytochrome P450 monooxygenase family 3 subfamily A n=1 Tax=Fusarium napiforme TaxID=42672 RepID=A0A8H5MZ55_9HYPO|nr:cytochrome P450 monooxygenase family 3 subfamily A [Fusarium napiforme]